MAKDKYDYDQFGCSAKRVGQAVVDILSKDNHGIITAGEITESQADKYRRSLEDAIDTGTKLYKSPFFVLVVTNKEFWAENVVRNWFVPRQTCPYASTLYQFYPNHMKTLYMVDVDKGQFEIIWSLPGVQDMNSIIKTPHLYHPRLVQWITDFTKGRFDKDSYDFSYDPLRDDI